MSVNVDSVQFHSGAPAWLGSYRYPGYWIRGRGFGTRRGLVTIDGQPQTVVEWSPDSILIAEPRYDIYWRSAHAPRVVVQPIARRRGPEFMAIPPMWNDGSIAPVKEISYCRAA